MDLPPPRLMTPPASPFSPAGAPPEEARRAALEFETMVLKELLAPMFEALDTEGLGGGGIGEQMFRPMLVERYAAAVAQRGGIGLADAVMAELVRLQTPAQGES